MHLFLNLLAQATTTTTIAKSSKSSSSYWSIIILIVLFGAVYLLFLRPRQQRMRQQQQQARQLSVGDEVMSAGGIYGRVVALDADAVEVEVATGVVMTFTRRAISPRPGSASASQTPPEPVDEPWQVEPTGPGDRAGDGEASGGSTGGGTTGPGGGEDAPPAPGSTGV